MKYVAWSNKKYIYPEYTQGEKVLKPMIESIEYGVGNDHGPSKLNLDEQTIFENDKYLVTNDSHNIYRLYEK